MQSAALIAPVVALALWTHVIMVWMYATRIPAITAARLKLDREALRGEQMGSLPARVRWKADNYNHLMEQPTLFYAMALALAVLGGFTGFDVAVAWVYVGLRVIHSLVQVVSNWIELRFTIFLASATALIVLTVRVMLALL